MPFQGTPFCCPMFEKSAVNAKMNIVQIVPATLSHIQNIDNHVFFRLRHFSVRSLRYLQSKQRKNEHVPAKKRLLPIGPFSNVKILAEPISFVFLPG